jgi:ligand-binding sensor protein
MKIQPWLLLWFLQIFMSAHYNGIMLKNGITKTKKQITDQVDTKLNGCFMNKISITDIIDIEELQKLQDAFAISNGIAATITDTKGNPITRPSNHTQVCKIIRKTTKGLENCVLSGKKLGKLSSKMGKPICKECYSIGFLDAAAPIIIEGAHIATWLIGQGCIGKVDEKRIISYAQEIDADKNELLYAFKNLNKISESEFRDKLNFLWIMATLISNVAYQRLRNQILVEDLTKAKTDLEGYKDNLEQLVEQKISEIKKLSGLLPLCSHCKKVRDDKGYWNQIDTFIEEHSAADISHSICPECADKYYPDMNLYDDDPA